MKDKANSKKIILVITGSRSTYGLYRPIISKMLKSEIIAPRVLVTGMHTLKKYGYTLNEIRADKFPIVSVVKINPADDMLTTLTKEILGIRAYCLGNKVDTIMVLGDTDHMFAGAIVGGHLNIPVIHIAGGDITGRVVDETIRHSITKFSHLHFTSTKSSYLRVLRLGEDKWRVFNVGAPGLVGLKDLNYLSRHELASKYGINPEKKWILVLQHPTPLDDEPILKQIRPLLQAVSSSDGEKILIYPNSDSGSDIFVKEILKHRNKNDFHLFESLPRLEYLSFFKVADLLIGNSSSGIVESAYFYLPTINVGNRQGNRERGRNVIDCGYDLESIKKAMEEAVSAGFMKLCKKTESPYGDGTMAEKTVKIIEKQIGNPRLLIKGDLPT